MAAYVTRWAPPFLSCDSQYFAVSYHIAQEFVPLICQPTVCQHFAQVL